MERSCLEKDVGGKNRVEVVSEEKDALPSSLDMHQSCLERDAAVCKERGFVAAVSEQKKDLLLRSLEMDRSSLERDVAVCKERGFVAAVSEEKKDLLLRSLAMDHSSLERDVAAIRTWLEQQPHLPPVDGDVFIKSFIIGCKGDLDKVKRKLENYYLVRNVYPEIFKERDPMNPNFQHFAQTHPMVFLPQLTEEGCRVLVGWLAGPDPKGHNTPNGLKRIFSALDIYFRTEAHIAGDFIIGSCAHANFGHLFTLSPHDVWLIQFLAENVIPFRLKKMILFNAPPAATFIMNYLIKPIVKSKFLDKVIMTSEDHRVLPKYVKREILPKEFGGDGPDLETLKQMWMDTVMERRDWFLAERKVLAREELRPKAASKDKLWSFSRLFRRNWASS